MCVKLNWLVIGEIVGLGIGGERLKLYLLVSELILLIVIWLIDVKNWLKLFVMVLLFLLNDFMLVDFFGMKDWIVFYNWFELLGLFVIWFVVKVCLVDFIFFLMLFLRFL